MRTLSCVRCVTSSVLIRAVQGTENNSNATSNTFASDQLKPRVWNFPRDACFCQETSDLTDFRFVACQDFEAINLRFSTSKSVRVIVLTV